jgi:hypothetical protein
MPEYATDDRGLLDERNEAQTAVAPSEPPNTAPLTR